MFLAILVLLAALILSSTAAVFSVIGLTELFAASMIAIIIMGAGLEFAKIVTVAWLHKNWRNVKVHKIMKTYMVIAILFLMLITDIGIFGFLSKSHLDSSVPTEEYQIKIDGLNQQIVSDQKVIDRANTQLQELDDSVNDYFKNNRITQGLAARKQQEAERKELANTISREQKDIDKLNQEILELNQQVSVADQKIGPIKYVAQLFWGNNYQSHIDSAVRTMILIIMCVFDPLALILIISSSISLSDYWEEKKSSAPPAQPITAKPEPKIEVEQEKKPIENIVKSVYNNFKHRHWGYSNPNDKSKK
jgi:hypothetical protein